MYPKHVIKIGTEKTKWGEAVVLVVDNQRTLAFPAFIDDSDRDAIDAIYSTFEWPIGWPLSNIPNFPPGKPLAGWDILGSHRGNPFYDPAVDDVITTAVPASPETNAANHSLQTVFDLAEKEVARMNPPKQTRLKIRRLRALHARLFKRDATNK